jgi:uncharacterized CHY-type Zn-finger protein
MKFMACARCHDEGTEQELEVGISDDDTQVVIFCATHEPDGLTVAVFDVTLTEAQKKVATKCAECGTPFDGTPHVH